jgi:elongation factor P
MVIRHEGHLFTVLDFQTAHSGKQRPTVHVKLRDLRSGNVGDRSLDQLGKIDEVQTETRSMQYLYKAGHDYVFMDLESFEQYPMAEGLLGASIDFLVESDTYRFLLIDGTPVSLQLAPIITMEVADTAPVEHHGGMSNIQKEARLSSGITVQVPLFIKTGDKIKLNTDTRAYEGKAH